MKPNLETRIEKYLAAVPPAISGADGHRTLFLTAGKLVNGFGLDAETATAFLLAHYNQRCVPPWTEKEIRHKCDDAAKVFQGQRGYLLKKGERGAAVRKPTASLPAKRQAVETFREHYDSAGQRFFTSEIAFPDGRQARHVYRRQSSDFYVLDGPPPTSVAGVWLFDYRAGDDSPWHLVKRMNLLSAPNNADEKPKKRITAFHWTPTENGDGVFSSGLGDLPRVPFLLPEVKEAEYVFIVEGEKSAVRLNALLASENRFPMCMATCFFGGSGGWKAEYDYAHHFRHKDVAIIADNDAKGREFARQVADDLAVSASRVRIYADYPPTYRPGDDVVELIAREYESRKNAAETEGSDDA